MRDVDYQLTQVLERSRAIILCGERTEDSAGTGSQGGPISHAIQRTTA